MPKTGGVTNPSCPTPSALLSPTDRNNAESCKGKHHASPKAFHKVSSREHKEHSSKAAAGCCGKYFTAKEPKVTVHPAKSITGLQEEIKEISSRILEPPIHTIILQSYVVLKSQQNYIWLEQQLWPTQHPLWYHQ